ncbi:putative urease accessory protein UreF-like [Psilocybe cubensis]|uniref:Urease accessory protein UreF-like n=2 Tax=Psilocybe cubensis TaxID=181762 RepID=A0ACB8H3W3_PSICU|nr:putative urease accessory protein UreF-like [Psilocybe cubensis]KAH9482521.1 putative urease accessory protein UreF-like [Psilocybe cubensis]
MSSDHNDLSETYILLLLSDSNLPTGAFVASSGLESYVKHGFPSPASSPESATIDFVRDSLASYARTALPFVSDAHRAVEEYALFQAQDGNQGEAGKGGGGLDGILKTLTDLDELYQAMTLNHVARRASMSQGVSLLTLYLKGFSRPPSQPVFSDAKSQDHEARTRTLFDKFKLKVRREEVSGHLPVCWGALTAALGLALERSQYLHLFLHARSLLSASVRLNDLGPYGAQQILLHIVQPLVAAEVTKCQNLRTGLLDSVFDEVSMGPANTWPLGEILAGRHDLQHSRIFNS